MNLFRKHGVTQSLCRGLALLREHIHPFSLLTSGYVALCHEEKLIFFHAFERPWDVFALDMDGR